MALVMLPSDLPWWSTVYRKLTCIQSATDLTSIVEIMEDIHILCNVSLDPDDDKRDPTIFDGLKTYIQNLENREDELKRLELTIKSIAKRAQPLKSLRPPRGLSFSLQQQTDSVEIDRNFVAALLANAFFSTFPKRTEKTHPTLQDFNFTNFFRTLNTNSQKAKLQCFLKYFDWLEMQENFQDPVKMSRKVMTGKQWLTIDDWTECVLPLCPLDIKHQGRIENTFSELMQTVFCSSRLGGNALYGGSSQETVCMFSVPESLVTLLYVEALEDNEAILIENVHQISRIIDPKHKAIIEILEQPRKISLCCIDPENYCALPIDQFEEDNVLRELNKCLLAFRQNTQCPIKEAVNKPEKRTTLKDANGRLSPIGESAGSNSPKDCSTTIVIKHPSLKSLKSSTESYRKDTEDIDKRRAWLSPETKHQLGNSRGSVVSGPTASGRRGRFIVLGSSGECLPVKRTLLNNAGSSMYSSCDSDEEFHSAKGSFEEDSEDEGYDQKFSKELDTPEKRQTFAQRLRKALRQSSNYTESTESSYAIGISITGSQNCDEGIRLKRGGSTGFVLAEDSLDEEFYKESLAQEREWIDKFRNKQKAVIQRKDTSADSSKYSFSTEYSSELEELYEQFSKWMDDPIVKDENDTEKESDPRDDVILKFANSVLKRTLSESFLGVPLTDGCVSSVVGTSPEEASMQELKQKRNKFCLNAKSLSVELAKYKHRLAAQLKRDYLNDVHGENFEFRRRTGSQSSNSSSKRSRKGQIRYLNWSVSYSQSLSCEDVTVKISQLGQRHMLKNTSDLRPIATGNWGCGSTCKADVQLKLIIQWMSASVAGLPVLVYYTSGHEKLTKLDTVIRVLRDRKWTVGELATATLLHAKDMLDPEEQALDEAAKETDNSQCFFDKLIGI